MSRLAFLSAALVVTTPAFAQDLATQYATAFQSFSVTGQSDRYFLQPEGVFAQVLPTLDGRWMDALSISGNTSVVDAERMADLCENGPANISIQATADNSFNVTERPDGDQFLIQHSYLAGNWFDTTIDVAAFAAILGKPADDPFVQSMLTRKQLPIAVFTPGPDVLVMLPAGGMVQIYTRCPA